MGNSNKTSPSRLDKKTEVIHRLDSSNEWTLTDQLSGVFCGYEYSLDYYVGFEKSKKARYSNSIMRSSKNQLLLPQQASKIILQIQPYSCRLSDAPSTTPNDCDSSSSRQNSDHDKYNAATTYAFYVGKDEVLCTVTKNNNTNICSTLAAQSATPLSNSCHCHVDALVYSKLIEHVSCNIFLLRLSPTTSSTWGNNPQKSLKKIQLCKYSCTHEDTTGKGEETVIATFEREDSPSMIGASSFICIYKQRRSGESEVLCEDLKSAFMNFVLRYTEEIFKHEYLHQNTTHVSER
ncbi:hypothetical protein FDP41_000708 [Naegleria fowleri]|uniref:Uncharacterized protein n=1 Tax=Naegleria fowleri TaxID=5763 RepID=A0A6A5CHP1_NAEFO|nr:uncharacterized protein FDP41_000708 [Naegleria fowleri]KAF0984809.1 hypothetical protein FDP41_000708 [Naegleria fowleri]